MASEKAKQLFADAFEKLAEQRGIDAVFVSDVVELRDPVGDTPAGFYFCDSVGFKEIKDFK